MTITSPKAFISYSWSSPGHRELIRSYGERLLNDGIDVVLDQWSLAEGQDKYKFMEQMVADPSVTHVLIFSDRVYAEKANERKEGVGAESQIISKEVYDKVDQKKFLPVVCEKQENEEPYLPVFLQSRIWIDFSTPERVNENWEKLLRAVYDKPIHEKPILGRPPSYLLEEGNRPALPTLGKFATLRDALLNSKPTLALCRQDFLDAAFEFADGLRVRETLDITELEDKVLRDVHTLLPLRDQFIDWLLIETSLPESSRLEQILMDFLEKVLALKYRPPELTSWNDEWYAAHDIFVYEVFLYVIAVLIKADRPDVINSLLTSHYMLPDSEARGNGNFATFVEFRCYTYKVLEARNRRLQLRRRDPIADLIKERATRSDLPFKEVMQAELVIFLVSVMAKDKPWYPRTLIYSGSGRQRFPLFVRAEQHRHFKRLQTITGINTADELRTKFKEGLEQPGVKNWTDLTFWADVSFWRATNMDSLDTIK